MPRAIWNGTVIDQRVSKDLENELRYVLSSRTDGANECRILVDEAAHAKGDPRDLGLELVGVSWEPVIPKRSEESGGGPAERTCIAPHPRPGPSLRSG